MYSNRISEKTITKSTEAFNNLVSAQYDTRLPGSQRISSYIKKKPSPYSTYDINGHKMAETPSIYNIKANIAINNNDMYQKQHMNGEYSRQAGALREELHNGFQQLQDNITSSQLVFDMKREDIERDHVRLELPQPQIKPVSGLSIERIKQYEQPRNKIIQIQTKENKVPQLTKQVQQELLQIIKFPLDKTKDVKDLVYEYKYLKQNKFQQINAIKQLIQMYGAQYNKKLAKNVNPILVCFKKLQQYNSLNKLTESMIKANDYQYELMMKLIVIKSLQKVIQINQHVHSSQFTQQISGILLKKAFILLKKAMHIRTSNNLLAKQHYQYILLQRLFYYMQLQLTLKEITQKLKQYEEIKVQQAIFTKIYDMTNNSREKQLFDVLTSKIAQYQQRKQHGPQQSLILQFKRDINTLSFKYKVIKQKIYQFQQSIVRYQIQFQNENNILFNNGLSIKSFVYGAKQQLAASSTNLAKSQTQLVNTSMVKSKLNIFMAPNIPLTNVPNKSENNNFELQTNNLQSSQLKIYQPRNYLDSKYNYQYGNIEDNTFKHTTQLQQSYIKLHNMKQQHHQKVNLNKSRFQSQLQQLDGKEKEQQQMQQSDNKLQIPNQQKVLSINSLLLDKKTRALIIRSKYVTSHHQLMCCNNMLYLHTDEKKHQKMSILKQMYGVSLQLKLGSQFINSNNQLKQFNENQQQIQFKFFDVNNLNTKLIQYLKLQSIYGAVDVLANVYLLYKALIALKTVYYQQIFYQSIDDLGDIKQKQLQFKVFQVSLFKQQKREDKIIHQFQRYQAKRQIFYKILHIHEQIIDQIDEQKAAKVFKLVIIRRQIRAWHERAHTQVQNRSKVKQIVHYLQQVLYYGPVFNILVETYKFIVSYRKNESKVAIFMAESLLKRYFNQMYSIYQRKQYLKQILQEFFIQYFKYQEEQSPIQMLNKCFTILQEQKNDNLSYYNMTQWYTLKQQTKVFKAWSQAFSERQLQKQFQYYMQNKFLHKVFYLLLDKQQELISSHEKVQNSYKNYQKTVIWEQIEHQYNINTIVNQFRQKVEYNAVSRYCNQFVDILLHTCSDEVTAKYFYKRMLQKHTLQWIIIAFLGERKLSRFVKQKNMKILQTAFQCLTQIYQESKINGWIIPNFLAGEMKADGLYVQKLEKWGNGNQNSCPITYNNVSYIQHNILERSVKSQNAFSYNQPKTTKRWYGLVRLWDEQMFRRDMSRTQTLDDMSCSKYISMFHYHIYRVVFNAFKHNVQQQTFYNSKRVQQTITENIRNSIDTNTQNMSQNDIKIQQMQNYEVSSSEAEAITNNSISDKALEQNCDSLKISQNSDQQLETINISCTPVKKQQEKQNKGDDIFQKKVQQHKNWCQNYKNRSKNSQLSSHLQEYNSRMYPYNKYNEQIKQSLTQQKSQGYANSVASEKQSQSRHISQNVSHTNEPLTAKNDDHLLPPGVTLYKQQESEGSEEYYARIYQNEK